MDASRAPSPPLDASARESIIYHLLSALHLPTSVDVARAADAAALSASSGADGWRQLVHTCEALGLRATEGHGDLASLGSALYEGRVAMIVDPSGTSWTLVEEERGRALRIRTFPGDPRGQWSSPFAIASAVGPGARWGWVEAALPAAVMTGTTPMARLAGLARAERGDVWLVALFGFGIGLLSLATPAAVQVLINTVAYGTLRQPLIAISGLLLLSLASAAGLRAMQQYVIELLQRRLFLRVTSDLSRRLPRVPLATFDHHDGPELVNRLFDVITLQKASATLLVDGLSAAVQALIGLVLLALYHPYLLGYDLVLIAVLAFILVGLGAGATETSVAESRAKYEVIGWLQAVARQDWLHKLGTGRRIAEQRADRLTRDYLRHRERHFHIVFRQFTSSLALQALGATLMLGGGGWLVVDGQLTLGQLVAAEYIVATVLISFTKFTAKLETAYDLFAAADKMGHLFDLPVERDVVSHQEVSTPVAVALSGVGFAYEMEGDDHGHHGHHGHTTLGPDVFTGFNLDIPAGVHMAIAADGAEGKSTLADLVLGFRAPTAGSVTWESAGLAVTPTAVQRRAALVREDTVLATTLFDNVAMARPEVSVSDVRAALKAVGLEGAVENLPAGLGTELLASGQPLSESQRIKLGFARAIATQPRLLVVDGALDRLGSTDRSSILRMLTDARGGWTLILLTRDPSLAAQLPVHFMLTPKPEAR